MPELNDNQFERPNRTPEHLPNPDDRPGHAEAQEVSEELLRRAHNRSPQPSLDNWPQPQIPDTLAGQPQPTGQPTIRGTGELNEILGKGVDGIGSESPYELTNAAAELMDSDDEAA